MSVRTASVADPAVEGTGAISEAAAKEILRAAGIPVPRGTVITHGDEDVSSLTGPLVVKAIAPDLLHKSDAGAVRLGVRHDQVAETVEELRGAVQRAGHEATGFLVEEMAPAGHEVVLGAVRSPELGWTVMLGLGGVFVEVLADVAFGLAPLTPRDIEDMLGELRSGAILDGARGGIRADRDALASLISRFAGPGGLLESLDDDIVEIDINPVIVSATGAVAVDALFVRGAASGTEPASPPVTGQDFTPLITPRVVAVLGAKSSGVNSANKFIHSLRDAAFTGRIIPVHPKAAVIEGLPTVSSLGEIDEPVDYAYTALPAPAVAGALTTRPGGLRFAQVISSGFSETEEGVALEHELVARMRSQGTRVIGPNCLGAHSSRARFSFIPDPPLRPGGVSIISQSGGLSVDFLRLGAARGLAFHTLTSIGSSADVSAAELVAAAMADDDTNVIGLYLESLAKARQVHDVLTTLDGPVKPVVLLAGGRSSDGSRAATSHTGALASNHLLWPALARQAGMILVDSVEQFIDTLLAFDTLDHSVAPAGTDVLVFGNGGGASVLAADALAGAGLRIPRLDDAVIERLDSLGLPPGNGLENPVDVPASTLAVKAGAVAGDILAEVLKTERPAAVITHLNVGIIQRNLQDLLGDVTGRAIRSAAEACRGRTRHVLVLKGDGDPTIEAMIATYSEQAKSLGIPTYSTFEAAAAAVRGVLRHDQFNARRATDH